MSTKNKRPKTETIIEDPKPTPKHNQRTKQIKNIIKKSNLQTNIFNQVWKNKQKISITPTKQHQIDGKHIGDLELYFKDQKEKGAHIYGKLIRTLKTHQKIPHNYELPLTKPIPQKEAINKLKEILQKTKKLQKERTKQKNNLPNWKYKGTEKGHYKQTTDEFYHNPKKDLWIWINYSKHINSWTATISREKKPKCSDITKTAALPNNSKTKLINNTIKAIKNKELPNKKEIPKKPIHQRGEQK